jgi:hypothetical protein
VPLPKASACWLGEIVECEIVAITPSPECASQRGPVAAALDPIQPTAFAARVAHPARADSRPGVAERPVALGGWESARSSGGWTWRKVAADVVTVVLRFSGEFAASQADPQWSMGIGAGQGKASGGQGPCPLSPDEDGQGPRCLHGVPSPVLSDDHVVNLSATSDTDRSRDMNIIRVLLAPEFKGEDVVLLVMDGAGVTTFINALGDAEQRGSSELEHDGVTHQFVIQAGAADIELGEDRVVWRLDHAKAVEIVGNLTVMSGNDGPAHDYVDIAAPTNTLIVSRDEYVRGLPPPEVPQDRDSM